MCMLEMKMTDASSPFGLRSRPSGEEAWINSMGENIRALDLGPSCLGAISKWVRLLVLVMAAHVLG